MKFIKAMIILYNLCYNHIRNEIMNAWYSRDKQFPWPGFQSGSNITALEAPWMFRPTPPTREVITKQKTSLDGSLNSFIIVCLSQGSMDHSIWQLAVLTKQTAKKIGVSIPDLRLTWTEPEMKWCGRSTWSIMPQINFSEDIDCVNTKT